MAVSWSRPGDWDAAEKRDLPDPSYIVAAMAVDPSDPRGVATAFIALEPTRHACPDGLPEPGVIEPSQVFKPCQRGDYWRNVTITYEEFD